MEVDERISDSYRGRYDFFVAMKFMQAQVYFYSV